MIVSKNILWRSMIENLFPSLLLFLLSYFESRFHAFVKKELQFTSIISLTSYLNFFPWIFYFLFLFFILFLREDFLLDLIPLSLFLFFSRLYSELERRDIYFSLESFIFFLFLIPFLRGRPSSPDLIFPFLFLFFVSRPHSELNRRLDPSFFNGQS